MTKAAIEKIKQHYPENSEGYFAAIFGYSVAVEQYNEGGEKSRARYKDRDIEVAYCIGLLSRHLTMDELSEELKTSKEKLGSLKEGIKRGDFDPLPVEGTVSEQRFGSDGMGV